MTWMLCNQLDERELNISTVVRTITVLINLAKYINQASEDVNSCVQLLRLKNVQRQLSQRQQSHRLTTKAGLCGNNTPFGHHQKLAGESLLVSRFSQTYMNPT